MKTETTKKTRTREEILASKIARNTRIRAANIAKGLTGEGKPRKRAYRPRKEAPPFGVPWTAQRRAKFSRTMRSKRKERLRAKFHAKIQARKQEKNSQHPHFTDEQLRMLEGIGFGNIMDALNDQAQQERLPDPRGFINGCPNCFLDLRPYYLAAGFKQHEPPKA
jgi:hypothetical protein